ncbi:hypothetical protein DFH09DRAFT_1073269 [Mycena vulgaris]|nr:hypothetical protein DFH09DRAFT_1073269 [Mycena vulgaris]
MKPQHASASVYYLGQVETVEPSADLGPVNHNLEKHTGITDDDEYLTIVALIEAEIPLYLDLGSSGWLVIDLPQICEAQILMRKYPDVWHVCEVEVRAYEVFLEGARSWAARDTGHPVQPTTRPRAPVATNIPGIECSSLGCCTLGRLRYGGARARTFILVTKTDAQFTNIFTAERAKAHLLVDLPPLIVQKHNTASPRKVRKEMELYICINLLSGARSNPNTLRLA